MKHKVEFIESYIKIGNDYKWNDNHGELIRCKDCKYYNPQQHYCEGIGNWFGYDGEWSDNGYCYKAERKENDTDRVDTVQRKTAG